MMKEQLPLPNLMDIIFTGAIFLILITMISLYLFILENFFY